MTFIYAWPSWVIIPLELFIVTGLAVLGQLIVRRTVPFRDLAKHNDVTGFVLAIVGVIYAVLLAFVVIIAWEGFNASERTAENEIAAASDLYRVAGSYAEPQRGQVRRAILEYARVVRTEEWPAMQKGEESTRARNIANGIGDLSISMIKLDRAHESAVNGSVMSLVHSFVDARRARLDMNSEGIPRALWAGLLLGAMLTIGFTYLFGVENFRVQLMMTGLLGALIGVMFAMIVLLDYPFRGDTSISPEGWSLMVDRIEAEHLAP